MSLKLFFFFMYVLCGTRTSGTLSKCSMVGLQPQSRSLSSHTQKDANERGKQDKERQGARDRDTRRQEDKDRKRERKKGKQEGETDSLKERKIWSREKEKVKRGRKV